MLCQVGLSMISFNMPTTVVRWWQVRRKDGL